MLIESASLTGPWPDEQLTTNEHNYNQSRLPIHQNDSSVDPVLKSLIHFSE